jgi:hypothetical protein
MYKLHWHLKSSHSTLTYARYLELIGKEEAQVSLPLSELPEGAGEGTWLDISFSINRKLTDDQYRKNRDLLDKIKRKKSGG